MTPEPRHDRNGWQAHQWNIWQTSASLFVYKATPSEKLQQRQRVRNIVLGMCGKNREDKQKPPDFCENKKNLEALLKCLFVRNVSFCVLGKEQLGHSMKHLNRRNKVIQVLNDMRVNKQWQNLNFSMNLPFQTQRLWCQRFASLLSP